MKFPKEVMQEIADLVVGESQTIADKEYKLVHKEHSGSSRWSQHYDIVFAIDGAFYESGFSRGSTESQDESPYEYDDAEIDCREVVPQDVVRTIYIGKIEAVS